MVMMVVVMMVSYGHYYHLRLRRIGDCEAEYGNQSKQKLLHSSRMRHCEPLVRAILTCARGRSFGRKSAHGICFLK
jgi:hypothetical protein